MTNNYELKQVRIQLREDTPLYSTEEIQSPQDAVRIMSDALAMMDREYCAIVCLDNRNRPINFHILSIGDTDKALVPIQNIFKVAILSNANPSGGIMLFHNHVSGVLSPSRDDEILTEKLIYAGKIMNINVLDHVIVGGNEGKYYSFREERGELFTANPDLLNDILSDSQSMRDQLKQITDQLEEGISEYFTSDTFRSFLTTIAKFHKYSFNNTLLIAMQNPEAKLVASYSAWQKKFHRQVRRGEKAIKIIAPMTFHRDIETEKVDPATGDIILGMDGQPEKEKKTVSYQRYKVTNVFDYAQTDGEPLPLLEVPELTDDHDNYKVFLEAARTVSPVPIRFDEIPGQARGYYDHGKKEVVIQKDMPQAQTMKTVIHEIGHALCHDRDFLRSLGEKKDRVTKELEAEAIAFCVSTFFHISNVSDYSFPYIAGWAADRPRTALQESMDLIRTTSGEIIDGMLEVFKEKGLYLDYVPSETLSEDVKMSEKSARPDPVFEIYQIDPEGMGVDQIFMGKEYLDAHGLEPDPEYYKKVYQGELSKGMDLEKIYENFNLHHPEDFTGHSLSVSDVVVIKRDGKEKAYFVDIFGFQELPDFIKTPLMLKPVNEKIEFSSKRTWPRKQDEYRKEAGIRI